MAHRVQVNTGYRSIELPDGVVYTSGDTTTLTDSQFSQLSSALFPSTLIDLGYVDLRPVAGDMPERYAFAGSPATGILRANMDRADINSDLAALTTQVMLSVGLYLEAGDVVTNLTFKSGATALAGGTNWWFALYDTSATPAKLAQTADQLTAGWAANTGKTLALAAPVTISKGGIYYAGVMVKATTPPSLAGAAVFLAGAVGALATSKALAQTSGTGLTTTAPATIASPTVVGTVAYVVAT